MKEIRLTQGEVALIDDGDSELVSKYKWCAMKQRNTFVAKRGIRVDKKHRTIYMHNFIMGYKNCFEIDHINHNGLDNRRANLRRVTKAQNQYNKQPKHGCSSKYKGVTFERKSDMWQAQIQYKGINKYLGKYSTPEEAALVYNKAAIKKFGEYAFLNKVILPCWPGECADFIAF